VRALSFSDHFRDPSARSAWARDLGVSLEAVELYAASDVIDLHIDTFIWNRTWGYRMGQRHGRGAFRARFYGHADFPRVREAGLTGAIWVITTNPTRRDADDRARVFVENFARLRATIESYPRDFALARTAAEYRRARAEGRHAAFIGIQGGNCLDRDIDALELIPDRHVVRITLVHMSNSRIGTTSAPVPFFMGRRTEGLTPFGREYVQRLDAKRIFVDLAHISKAAFWDAVEAHDKTLPLIDTHTGVDGVLPHWRNLDDAQIKAIAATGGTVGVMYHGEFIAGAHWRWKADRIVDHLAHIVKVGGDDAASLGSDWDGAIVTPRDMPTCLELPVLVQRMLDRRWSTDRIQKILGGNFLRALEALRG